MPGISNISRQSLDTCREHNASPSTTVGVAPYPIDWNSNTDLKDQTFFDLPHFEIRAEE